MNFEMFELERLLEQCVSLLVRKSISCCFGSVLKGEGFRGLVKPERPAMWTRTTAHKDNNNERGHKLQKNECMAAPTRPAAPPTVPVETPL